MGLSARTPDERQRLVRAVAEGRGYALQEIRVHLTRRCNLDCVMCRRGAPGPDPSADRILEIVDQAMPLGLKTVKFFGGEPLLRTDLEQLVGEVTRRGLRSTITTNGVLLERGRARALVEAGLTAAAFSIESPVAATHDRIRGIDGAWKKTVRGIDALVAARDARDDETAIHLNAVVMRRNLREIPGLVAFCRDHGVSSLSLIPVSIVSLEEESGGEMIRDLLPTAEDIRWWNAEGAVRMLDDARRMGVALSEENAWLFGRTEAEQRAASEGHYVDAYLAAATCLRPWFHLTIDAALNVFACRRVRDPELQPLGSLETTSLKEIWEGEKCRTFRARCRRPSFPECRYCCLPVMIGNAAASRRYLQ